jgi:hypothetical protein
MLHPSKANQPAEPTAEPTEEIITNPQPRIAIVSFQKTSTSRHRFKIVKHV